VVGGHFGVYGTLQDTQKESVLGTLGPGDFFGEMALLSGEPRVATVRALEGGNVVRLDNAHFDALLQREPSVAQSIATTLVRRIRQLDRALLERSGADREYVLRQVTRLSEERRARVLQASLLADDLSPTALSALFPGAGLDTYADMARFIEDRDVAASRLRILVDLLVEKVGRDAVPRFAREAAERLAEQQQLPQALALVARHGSRQDFLDLLADSLRRIPAPSSHEVDQWVEVLSDEESERDVDLALAKTELYERQGNRSAAARLVLRSISAAIARQDATGAQRLTGKSSAMQLAVPLARPDQALEEMARPSSMSRRPSLELFRMRVRPAALIQGVLTVALVAAAAAMRGDQQWSFSLLLAAALILWSGEILPNYAVSIGLVVGWMLLGLTDAVHALSGFASLNWLFVFALLALADCVARSGLLFRLGLLLTRRMPRPLWLQAALLMATGALMAPLLPQNQARAALTAPLALTVADGQRLPPRSPAAAVLGLSTWIGSGPLMFIFLNGSPLCLLAWGLLPEADRVTFNWVGWLAAAAPLGIAVAAGSILMLFLIFRPPSQSRTAPERVDMQMALLGRMSPRELKVTWVMVLTLAGFIFGPLVGIDIRVVAPLTFVLAVLIGVSDKRSLQELDWGYLVFLGVVLTVPAVLAHVGLDDVIANKLSDVLDVVGRDPLIFLLATCAITMVARLAVDQYQGTVLFCTMLMPAAASLGINPWLVAVTVLATSAMWFVPNQTNSYVVTYASSEGRLFSHGQARLACFWYVAVVVGGLMLSVPYWRAMGLL